MAMHTVRLSFVAQETSRGGELLLSAGFDLAAERLQVRVNELAKQMVSTGQSQTAMCVLVVALELRGLVRAVGLRIILPRAVVKAIRTGCFVVQRVVPVPAFIRIAGEASRECH